MKRSKGELQFYFKTESVIMRHRSNYIIFHKFLDRRRKINLERFTKSIIYSRTLDLNKVFELARKHKVDYAATTQEAIIGVKHEATRRNHR
jgi:hypothetical protein